MRTLSLVQVRSLPRIASGYTADRRLTVSRTDSGDAVTWRLREEVLPHPVVKEYDDGDAQEWLQSYLEVVSEPKLQFAAALRRGTVAGLVTWSQLEWNNSLWLVDIRVREAARGTGIGSALMRHLQQQARQADVRGIGVETQGANYPAIRFYQKHGFQVSGVNDHLYENDDLARQDVAVFLFWECDAG